GDAYRICKKNLERRHDGGLELVLHEEKNNQGVTDILFYLSKVPDLVLVSSFFRETYRSKKGCWYKSTSMGYRKLRKMMNDIATHTDIDLSNGRKITNHSCCYTAIQLLKNNGLSDSNLQPFSRHRLCESLADYCKLSDDQPQAIQVSTAYAIEVPTAQTTEVPIAQATKVHTANQVSPQIQNPNKVKTSRLSKLKSCTQTHPSSSVMAPFKPPCLPNLPLLASYRQCRKPLSAVNNIIIQLPSSATSQSYNLKIDLKIN
ncbi:4921_t:CDS:2, partial [Cetraspora pellucida]